MNDCLVIESSLSIPLRECKLFETSLADEMLIFVSVTLFKTITSKYHKLKGSLQAYAYIISPFPALRQTIKIFPNFSKMDFTPFRTMQRCIGLTTYSHTWKTSKQMILKTWISWLQFAKNSPLNIAQRMQRNSMVYSPKDCENAAKEQPIKQALRRL